jgi:hypothetical protein
VKRAARLLAVVGIAALASYFFRATPRDVVLVYDLGEIADATSLDVRIEKGEETVRRAEFPSPSRQVHHQVQLTDGAYHVRVDVDRPGAPVQTVRDITVSESQTIVLSVAP